MSTINKLPFSNQFEKGHSFNWAGDWTLGKYYKNDEYITDFVVYNANVVLYCRENHIASTSTEPELIYKDGKIIGVDSIYWGFVLHSESMTHEELVGVLQDDFAAKQDVIETVNVTVDDNTGVPSATAHISGNEISFEFKNLKGNTGNTGPQGPKGEQGNTGSSVDYPYELINNITTDDPEKGLSAAQGKILNEKIETSSIKIINGSVPNHSNSNAVSTEILRTNGYTLIGLHIKRAPTDGYHYVIGYGLTSSENDIGSIDDYYNWTGKIVKDDVDHTKNIAPIDISFYPTAVGIAFTICESNGTTYNSLRKEDLELQVELVSAMSPRNVEGLTIRNGSNGNISASNSVCTEFVKTNGANIISINTTRPNKANCVYWFGYSLTSSENDIGTTKQNYELDGLIKSLGYTQNLENRLIDVSSERNVVGISFTIIEYNTVTMEYEQLRIGNFTYYDISIDTIYINDTINIAKQKVNAADSRYLSKEGALLQACRYMATSATSKDLQIAAITDIHANKIALKNEIAIANAFNTIDATICFGDIVGSVYWEAFRKTFTDEVRNSEKPYFVCLGNHDVGNSNYVGFCPTHQQEYDAFIKPMVDAGFLLSGEYTNGLSYYYHDFVTYGIRLIVLNEYDDPMDFDETYWQPVTYNADYPTITVNTTYTPNSFVNVKCYDDTDYTAHSFKCIQTVTTPASFWNNSHMLPSYKIRRGYRVIRSAQAQWFLDALANTPAGYSVVVVLHNPISEECTNQRNKKFAQDIQYSGEDGIQNDMETDFIADAINAFVNGVYYSTNVIMKGEASYLNTQGGYAYSVSKDFSQKNLGVKFLCYLGGHCHRDLIFKHDSYLQYQISPICATTQWQNNANNDIKRTDEDGYGKDCLTIVSFAKDSESVKLVKIGVDVTTDMTVRDQEVIKLTE